MAVGLTLFTGQFLFQFFAIASGLPPGLAAVVTLGLVLVALPAAGEARANGSPRHGTA